MYAGNGQGWRTISLQSEAALNQGTRIPIGQVGIAKVIHPGRAAQCPTIYWC